MTVDGRDGTETSIALERLTSVLFSEESLDSILERVVRAAHELLEPVMAASVTLNGGSRYRTAAHSHEAAREIDLAQYDSGRGPCLESIRTGEPVEIEDIDEATDWPEVVGAARAHGSRSVLAIPMTAGSAGVVGALNLYSAVPGGFREIRDSIDHFARNVAVVLANAQAYTDATTMSDGLRHALATRELIGVAKGILIARQGLGWDESFEALRERSQRENAKLREVAAAVVREATGTPPPGE